MNNQPKYKSYVMWVGIISQVTIEIELIQEMISHGFTVDLFKAISLGLLAIATIIGIVNNPNDSTKY